MWGSETENGRERGGSQRREESKEESSTNGAGNQKEPGGDTKVDGPTAKPLRAILGGCRRYCKKQLEGFR